jgi:hypothetical protein
MLIEFLDLGANVACGTLLSSMTHILHFLFGIISAWKPNFIVQRPIKLLW